MRRLAAILVLFAVASPAVRPAATSSFEYSDSAAVRQLRWHSKTINVVLSKSLNHPGANIKIGSDVMGAARRALSRWSAVTEIKFVVSESHVQSISKSGAGDGISLITVADTPQNNAIFNGNSTTGRTRVFYDEGTGEISEADVVINPHPTSANGLPVQFSTDGTRGTYDLESTFTHEIGHLLGLDHSPIISSTMHANQALNGVYNKPAFTERTLSEEDRARVRSIYGPLLGSGTVEGKISQINSSGRQAATQTEVWVEENHSGRIIASAVSGANGAFRIDNLLPSNYRMLNRASNLSFGASVASEFALQADRVEDLDVVAQSPLTLNRNLNPRLIGADGELSTTPIPLEPGSRLRIYLAGEGLDQVSPEGILVNSPFFKIDSASLQKEAFQTSYPVISFEITSAANTPFGDYSIRLQSKAAEVAYIPGAITVDPGVESEYASPTDDPAFFVRQHYRDLFGRDADAEGLEYWTNQLEQCGQDVACLRARRLKISTAFFSGAEFQEKEGFLFRLYRTAFGRAPAFAEFAAAREQFTNIKTGKQTLVDALIESEDFQNQYPKTMTAGEFVDALVINIRDRVGIDLGSRRERLRQIAAESRTKVIQAITDDNEIVDAEYDRAFVLMQYFGYLQRDPDEDGYKFWLNALSSRRKNDPARLAAISCAFVNSAEYQSRFGMLLTHNSAECGKQ